MATYDLEEQEQLAEIKAWWKQYGNLLTNVLLAAAIAVVGWRAWDWYQQNQSVQASAAFNVLQTAMKEKDTQRVKAASGELLEKYSRTNYATLGALVSAKAMIDAGDLKSAKAQLQWVVDNGKNEMRDLARLRLATVLLDEKAYDEALKQLDGTVGVSFEARFFELRGDIFAAQGKSADAQKAYQSAIGKLGDGEGAAGGTARSWQNQSTAIYRELMQQKLDSLGGSK